MKIGSFEFNLRELAGSLAANMAVGFLAGLAAHYLIVRRTGGAADGER